METTAFTNSLILAKTNIEPVKTISSENAFIQANTIGSTIHEIREHHIIPVFIKDNEPLISQTDFIEATTDIVHDIYAGEVVLEPNIRLSHPIKGRIPTAKDKPAISLLAHEKTLYYERMAFVIELPGISQEIEGNKLNLIVGGIKAYNQDNLYSKKGADEHFKIFIGFQNKVCTNLCIWTDGYKGDLTVRNMGELRAAIRNLLMRYNQNLQSFHLGKLSELEVTEAQFAHILGKCRMFPFLPQQEKKNIQPILFGDSHLSLILKDYYKDQSFCKSEGGNINLWRLYNLFTGSSKSSYIDTFIPRNVNAFTFVEHLRFALQGKCSSWYIN